MKTEDLDTLFAAREPGRPALVRFPGYPNDRFEVMAVNDGRADIASRGHQFLDVPAELLDPHVRQRPSPPLSSLLDATRIAAKLAAEHPDCMAYHRRKLEVIQADLDGMYGAVIVNAARTTAEGQAEVTGR